MDKNFDWRFWEIDFLRGLAIVMMIVYHFFYDLDFFNVYNAGISSGFWWYFARATATAFILLVGVSLTLSCSRAMMRDQKSSLFPRYLKRGLKIFSWGLIITLMTRIFLREGFIVFGVLHLIGISIILAYPLLKRRFLNLLLGFALISFGVYLNNFTFDFPWLLWLGFAPSNFYTVDYFPVFPWFGVVLIGVFFGNSLYPNYARKFSLRDLSNFPPVRLFCFLGRHSLLIYLIHQPMLIALLYILGVGINF